MGIWAATFIGINAMIGTGIFALIGVAVESVNFYNRLSFNV